MECDATGQDLAPPPDITSDGYGRCPLRALDGSEQTPIAGKSGSCPAGEETAGHEKGVKRAPGVKFWVAGHEKGVKRAREGRAA